MTQVAAETTNGKVNQKLSLMKTMADRFCMDPEKFADCIRSTVMPPNSTNEEFAAFLLVCHQYELNPILKEVHCFRKKDGGIQPIVGVDGWMSLINRNAQYDGVEFAHIVEAGVVIGITCTIYRKDRTRPTVVTEWLRENKRGTDLWNNMPSRMLRHRALIQTARLAFGISGIMDDDEGEEFKRIEGTVVESKNTRTNELKGELKNRVTAAPALTLPPTPAAEELKPAMTPEEAKVKREADVSAAVAANPNAEKTAEEKAAEYEAKKAARLAKKEAEKKTYTCVACQDTGKNSKGANCPLCNGPKTGTVDPVIEKALEAASAGADDPFNEPAPQVADETLACLESWVKDVKPMTDDKVGDIKNIARGAWKVISEEQRAAVLTSMGVLDFGVECKAWTPLRWKNFVAECLNAYKN